MIKKRHLVIISAIVAVLLGSLLYNNIAQAQRGKEPNIYKDSVEIDVLDWSARLYGYSYPIELGVQFDRSLEFPFVFSPIGLASQGDLNITSLWVNIIASTFAGQGGTISFKIGINDNATLSINGWAVHFDLARTVSAHLENHPSLRAIEQGINVLQLYDLNPSPLPVVTLHEIRVFIEYEYQTN